jgi:Uma2 family endonuclease
MGHLPDYPKPPPRSSELVLEPGEPMETDRHLHQMMVLFESLEHAWRDRDDFYIGANTWLYYSETQAKKNDFRSPDIMIALDTTRRERRCWVVWEEDGKSPDVVIELLSPSTEHVDRGEKKRIYSRLLRTLEYFLFDPYTGVLEGFDLNSERDYVPKLPDAQGRLYSNQLKLLLGTSRSVLYGSEVDWLRWMTPDGRVLPMPQEEVRTETERANAETERANAETERANAETERASRLQAEIDELKKQLAEK